MTAAKKKIRILIAEDERDIRDLINITLGFAGYEVIPTNNGEEAYQAALRETPDLILLDVRMPRMTGQESEVKTGLEVGAEEYILKPFSPDQLVTRIEAILKSNHEK
jgi:DNA-binding response OmpR family regulator